MRPADDRRPGPSPGRRPFLGGARDLGYHEGVRLGAALLLVVPACAGRDTMPWPEISPRPPSAAAPERAAGGSIEVEPPPTLPLLRVEEVGPAPTVETRVEHVPRVERWRSLTLRWPLPATGVNSLFGTRVDPVDGKQRFHAGIDLESDYGAVVQAAADGYVAEAGWHAGHGRRVVIEHAGAFATTYSHLSQVLAIEGTWVRAGQALGRVGNSGRSTGPHLHLELSRYGQVLDPLDYLGTTIPLD
jgi:murein DD-endopeptidase MepM/ murein hydrolase activator NlpD